MSKRITIVVKDRDRQYEGLRFSLGLMFENHDVCMVVLDHEVDTTAAYAENAAFIDEMGGTRLSNADVNIKRHGFEPVTVGELISRMAASDMVVPF